MVIVHESAELTSTDFMVMKILKGQVVLSAIFGYSRYKDSLRTLNIKYVKSNYKRACTSKKSHHPVVKARYDHQLMQRINKLDENIPSPDVYGDRSSCL